MYPLRDGALRVAGLELHIRLPPGGRLVRGPTSSRRPREASKLERKCASKRPGRAESAFAELTYVGRRLPRAPRGTTSRWAQSQWI
jgi:hypothetical protein